MNESLKIETNDNAELPLLINPDYSTTRFSVPPSSQRQTTRFSSERHISLTPQSSDRLASLDLFRGITIWFMCLVNHAGGSYEILEHALWNGLTIADFVMPFFLFIVGMAIALSFSKLKHGGQSRLSIFAKIIGRTAKLFFLGLIIQGWDFPFYDMYNIRIMGILQRIAIGYFIVSTVALFVPRTSPKTATLIVLRHYFYQWLVAFGVLALYLILTFAVDVPGCGRGLLTPQCNAAAYIDVTILQQRHMYRNPTCKELNPPCPYFEPEGLLTTWASSLSVFIGLYFGYIILHYHAHHKRCAQWLVASMLMLVLGIAVHFMGFPINKNLYSLSYILVTAGSAGIIFFCCYLLVDFSRLYVYHNSLSPFHTHTFVLLRSVSERHMLCFDICNTSSKFPLVWPFIWTGMNSIIIFIFDELIEEVFGGRDPKAGAMIYWQTPEQNLGQFVFYNLYSSWMSFRVANFLWGVSHACIWWIVAFIFYKKKIFIKL
jgi:heparan-alpha-glucosaminide N-acetyltransferase